MPGRGGRVQGAPREPASERGSQSFPEKSADGAQPACGEGRKCSQRGPGVQGGSSALATSPAPTPQPGSQRGRPCSSQWGWQSVPGGHQATEQAGSGRLSPHRPGHSSPARPASPGAGTPRPSQERGLQRDPHLLPRLGLGQPPAPSWAGVSRLPCVVSGRLPAADRAGAQEGRPSRRQRPPPPRGPARRRETSRLTGRVRGQATPEEGDHRSHAEMRLHVPDPQDSAAHCPRVGGPIAAAKDVPTGGAFLRRLPGCPAPRRRARGVLGQGDGQSHALFPLGSHPARRKPHPGVPHTRCSGRVQGCPGRPLPAPCFPAPEGTSRPGGAPCPAGAHNTAGSWSSQQEPVYMPP